MKILFDHPNPFLLAHGGFQVQIEQTRQGLIDSGVAVEFLEWWNPGQKGDIVHYFGRPPADYLRMAQGKGMKVVLAELLTATGSRSPRQLAWQRFCTNVFRRILPGTFAARMAWESYPMADACIALTPWEAHLMHYLFRAPRERIHVVGNGVESVFFASAPQTRGPWLVCTATITERKRVLELAQAALLAQTPVWIIGRPYAEDDPYARQFSALARQNPKIIRYDGPISNREKLVEAYRGARGFVLLSSMESLSLAALEAAACACPLLLSDLPWARTTFGKAATFCPVSRSAAQTASVLRAFYESAPSLPPPPKPPTWPEIALQLRKIYQALLERTG